MPKHPQQPHLLRLNVIPGFPIVIPAKAGIHNKNNVLTVILSAAKDLNRIYLSLLFIFFIYITPAHAQLEQLKNIYERAVNAYGSQQYDQAIDLYQKIIKVAPTFAPAYNGLALANQASGGDEDKTIEYLKTAISYDPKMVQAYDNLGRIYYGRQDVDESQEYFEKALKIDPNLTSAQMSLAWIYLLVRSKPEAAIKYFKEVLAVSQDPKVYYGLGSAYFASNQRVQALDMITKLHELGEEDLASRLEQSMRDNTVVNAQPDADSGTPSQPPGLGPLAPTEDKPTGIKVHLSGKLSDY
jgi:tetratricopeptide (TPR) repeat protein